MRAWKDLLRGRGIMARQVEVINREYGGLSLSQAQVIRQKLKALVVRQISQADEVLNGQREWTPQQVRLFCKLLDKVAPNISVSDQRVTVTHDDVSELSKSQLIEIASFPSKETENEQNQ
jgi:hypothetical protein